MITSLHRLRIVVVVVMAAVVSIAAGDVFDQFVWWLLLVPVAVGLASLVSIERRWTGRLISAAVATIASVVAVVATQGGSFDDVVASFGAGFQRVLSTDWPSPNRPDLIGTVATGLALMTAAATDLARWARLHISPLLAILVGQIGVIALSAPAGIRLRWILPLAALSIVLATLRPGAGVGLLDRLTLLRGERRLVPVSLVAIGLAAALAGPIAFTDRADPRRNEPAAQSAALLDPIEATLALQAIDPPIDLYGITIDDGGDTPNNREPLRWRTAALVDYDGRRWEPDLTLRPIGRRLGPPADDSISAALTFLDENLQLVPLPGAAITIDASIETDANRTIVRLAQRPSPDDVIAIASRVEPSVVEAVPGQIGIREIGDNIVGLAELADALADAGGASVNDDLLTQLRAIESTMSDDFLLRTDASGGGLQRALVERFLRDTQRGNAEQFSTGFVLLVRSLGVDARIAAGFEVDPERLDRSNDATQLTLTSDDARVWPEVRIGDMWVAFDPVPEDEDTDTSPPEPQPQVQSPAAPQPPIQLPPETADEPVDPDDDVDTDTARRLPTAVIYALAIGGGIAAILAPLILVVGVILAAKWRRRRRQLMGAPPQRIRGAWAVATDRLVDAGMGITGSDTNNDIARHGVDHAPTAHRALQRLATLATVTTFGDPVRPDLLAEDAATCLDQVEATMTEDRTGWQRLRWRLSLRSLRSATASPV